jgi:hypothetical protein
VPFQPIQATSSLGLLNAIKADATARNGSFLGLPKLSNGDLAQISDYYRKHEASAPGWDKLARIALGFFQEGDKFAAGSRFSTSHVNAAVPASSLTGVWAKAQGMSTSIDLRERTSQSFAPRAPDAPLFDSLAAGAFQILERERGRGGRAIQPPPVRELPKLPPPLDKIPDIIVKPRGNGLGILLIVVIALLAFSKGKR